MGIGIYIGNNSLSGSTSPSPPVPPSIPQEATDLIDRMIALGEEPTAAQKDNITITIQALLDDCLFARRFDALYFGRGYGIQSTKLNWIKDSFNLTPAGAGNLIFQEGIGYSSNGDSCLDTNFILKTDTVNMTYYDQCAFMKIGGAVGASGNWRVFMGCEGNNGETMIIGYRYDGATLWRMGGGVQDEVFAVQPVVGYNFMTKLSNEDELKILTNDVENIVTSSCGNDLPDVQSLTFLASHSGAGYGAFSLDESKFEVGGIGGYLSPAEKVIMRNIIDGYISRL